ncbi:hypothetical protein BSNK01_31170 [Bacillaceae bacterium]
MKLQHFDLIFVKGDSLVSRVIQKVTKSPYSHVAIVLDEYHVAETNWKSQLKIRHITYSRGLFDVYRFYRAFTEEEIRLMNAFLFEKLSTPYDAIQSITNGLYLLIGLPILDAPDRMNCSETADKMFHAAGIDLVPQALGKVTPADLAQSKLLKKLSLDDVKKCIKPPRF